MYQNVRIGSFFNVQLIMHFLNSFLSCSIRNLTLASLSRSFTIKIDVFNVSYGRSYVSLQTKSPNYLNSAITEA